MVSDTVSPANATRPASISKSTQPNAQMSLRLSTARPRACSGLMYAAVPMMAPSRRLESMTSGAFVRLSPPAVTTGFASPKSSTLTTPSGVTLMFAGFRSRWMIPFS